MNKLNLFFTGILVSKDYPVDNIYKILEFHFGPLILKSQTFLFTATDYYESEMGNDLQRLFVAFESLMCPSLLGEIKSETIEIEKKHFTKQGKRFVNLDPGYIDSVKIVLASTKFGGHKIAVSPTIYADMVLDFYKGKFRSFEWSFPDFKMGLYDDYFIQLRKCYLEKINA